MKKAKLKKMLKKVNKEPKDLVYLEVMPLLSLQPLPGYKDPKQLETAQVVN
ncbi:MAG: hypothetical protein Q8K64_08255 [Sediminibacterium sp.]|nr:hypothetical protein [Sediminibacterium sp.]